MDWIERRCERCGVQRTISTYDLARFTKNSAVRQYVAVCQFSELLDDRELREDCGEVY
jgi:hypothetical protein